MPSQAVSDPELETKPELTEAEIQARLQDAIDKQEKFAESCLDMAKLFIEKSKPEIARRRLQSILDEFASSAAATEARALLRKL